LLVKYINPMKLDTEKLKVNNIEKKKYRSDRIRDHLANERTYLAWMRSGIALMGFGVLIVRLRIIRPPFAPQPPGNGWKLGLAFALVGVLTVLLSTQHYFAVRRDIDEDTYQPPDRWILLASIAVLLLGGGVLYYVFTVPLEYLNSYILE
jgi:putative membrane protein